MHVVDEMILYTFLLLLEMLVGLAFFFASRSYFSIRTSFFVTAKVSMQNLRVGTLNFGMFGLTVNPQFLFES